MLNITNNEAKNESWQALINCIHDFRHTHTELFQGFTES